MRIVRVYDTYQPHKIVLGTKCVVVYANEALRPVSLISAILFVASTVFTANLLSL